MNLCLAQSIVRAVPLGGHRPVLWVLNDPGLYQLLVTQRRWTQRRFRGWLTNAMQSQLLQPGNAAAGKCAEP